MDDTNIGAPHLGHRRCILGGNVAGSKLCGCGMLRPPSLIQAGARPVSATDACRQCLARWCYAALMIDVPLNTT